MEYGSYDPYHFCIESIGAPGDALDADEIQGFIAKHPSVDDQVARAMRDVTLLHEIRHLHDSFGTFSGLTIFDAHISRLHAFLGVLKTLHEGNVRMRLPLQAWATEPGCPDFVCEFVRRITNGQRIDSVFLGRTEPQLGVGSTDQSSVDLKLGRLKYPAFPQQIGLVNVSQEIGNPAASGVIALPIGLEQLIEGNAQALQRDLLEAAWSKEVEERVMERMRVIATAPSQSTSTSFLALPYNVTDHALTRHLRLRYGITQFPRARLTELTDRALMLGRSLQYGETAQLSLPGGAFVTLMNMVDWKISLDEPLFQEPEHDDRETLAQYVESLEADPDPGTFLKTNSAQDAINACYFFARRHLALPLMKVRLQHGPAALNSFDGYTKHYAQLPVAPVMASRAGIASSPEVSDEMLRAWTRYAMISQLSLQIWRGNEALMCPRAFSLVPGLKFVDYNALIGCDVEEAKGRCSEWTPGDTREVPHCYFFTLLKLFGLR